VLKDKAQKDAERRLKKFEERSKRERDKQRKQFKRYEKECDSAVENCDLTANTDYLRWVTLVEVYVQYIHGFNLSLRGSHKYL
jgi:hypothetical protein